MSTELRTLGKTNIQITPIALGCWPITGVTSLDVTVENSLGTLLATREEGINFLDTAHFYGRDGESEKYIGEVLGPWRSEYVIATKGGIHWTPEGRQGRDASPATLRRQCEESLRRLRTDYVDLLYLHAPDPQVPIAESAGGIGELISEGKVRSAGASNVTLDELKTFHAACPVSAVQMPYNMIQREAEADMLPWCRENGVSFCSYWPLVKGLLAGKLPRDFVFLPGDGRGKYPMFQGQEWVKNQDLVDALRPIAERAGKTVAQLVILWTISQPGVTAALVGAKRPDQLRENAGGMGWQLSDDERRAVDAALAARGQPVSGTAVQS